MGAENGQRYGVKGQGTGEGCHLVWRKELTMLGARARDERRYYIPAGTSAWLCPGRGLPRLSGDGGTAPEAGRLGAQLPRRVGGSLGLRSHQGGGNFRWQRHQGAAWRQGQ